MICDSWQIIFSLEHASPGENSCSQRASGSWCTADPTPGLCRSESRPPEEREALCCGRVWTFYGTDPAAAVPWLRKIRRKTKKLSGHISLFKASFFLGNRCNAGKRRVKLALGLFYTEKFRRSFKSCLNAAARISAVCAHLPLFVQPFLAVVFGARSSLVYLQRAATENKSCSNSDQSAACVCVCVSLRLNTNPPQNKQ